MVQITNNSVVISIAEYDTLSRKEHEYDRLVEKLAALEHKYRKLYEQLESLVPTTNGIVLKTADGLMCYSQSPFELYQQEVRRIVLPKLNRTSFMVKEGEEIVDETKTRIYKLTPKRSVHGLPIFEEDYNG